MNIDAAPYFRTNLSPSSTLDSNRESGSGKTEAGTDFQTFLTLLTTQLRNQDPLKPMDSTQFVAQLASFSAVEQQVRTNEKLAEIINLLSSPATV